MRSPPSRAIRPSSSIVVVALCTGAAIAAIAAIAATGCERRRDIPAVGDASTTAATEPAPRGERPLEPAADAGEQAATPEPVGPAPGPRPVAEDERRRARERRLERATLTIVQAADRDRNLGIVTAAPSRIEVDAGSCDIGIEIKQAP